MEDIRIFSSSKELPEAWDILDNNDIFLSRDYLQGLENGAPANIKLYFVMVYREEKLASIFLVQHVKLYLEDVFRQKEGSALIKVLKNTFSALLKGNILVVGNLTHTGQHGIFYNREAIQESSLVGYVFKALALIGEEIRVNNQKKIRLYLLKDYFLGDSILGAQKELKAHGLYKAGVQPNMILKLRPHWSNFEDYYLDLNTKYKRRLRTAMKKLHSSYIIELSLEQIEKKTAEINTLYKNVSNNASFNTFLLPQNHFYELKKSLGINFRLFGCFDEGKLIGFYSVILNHETLETYFLGYDHEEQFKKQLYLNMLYKMLEFGIDNGFKTIVYARTAMEIKSSVGAKPESMLMFIKHTHPLLNFFMKPIFSYLDPSKEWEERHPFQ